MPEGHSIHRVARVHRRWLVGQTLAARTLYFCAACQGVDRVRRQRRARAR